MYRSFPILYFDLRTIRKQSNPRTRRIFRELRLRELARARRTRTPAQVNAQMTINRVRTRHRTRYKRSALPTFIGSVGRAKYHLKKRYVLDLMDLRDKTFENNSFAFLYDFSKISLLLNNIYIEILLYLYLSIYSLNYTSFLLESIVNIYLINCFSFFSFLFFFKKKRKEKKENYFFDVILFYDDFIKYWSFVFWYYTLEHIVFDDLLSFSHLLFYIIEKYYFLYYFYLYNFILDSFLKNYFDFFRFHYFTVLTNVIKFKKTLFLYKSYIHLNNKKVLVPEFETRKVFHTSEYSSNTTFRYAIYKDLYYLYIYTYIIFFLSFYNFIWYFFFVIKYYYKYITHFIGVYYFYLINFLSRYIFNNSFFSTKNVDRFLKNFFGVFSYGKKSFIARPYYDDEDTVYFNESFYDCLSPFYEHGFTFLDMTYLYYLNWYEEIVREFGFDSIEMIEWRETELKLKDWYSSNSISKSKSKSNSKSKFFYRRYKYKMKMSKKNLQKEKLRLRRRGLYQGYYYKKFHSKKTNLNE